MQSIERQAISAIRVLAADAIQKANSGHPGMPIGAAPMAYALWKQMKHNPKNPAWLGRDRFVLSAGHASMLEYALLHLYGYGLTVDDLKNFRQAGSRTPGHPEYGHTTGVEATTGPLGQGFAMAVGMAMAEAHMAAKFNREGFPIVDNHTFVLMGDGCMMEGATSEAASLAGTQKLGKLIALYDSNRITIEGDTATSFAENVAARYAAYGWQVISVDNGEDVNVIGVAIETAKAETEKPSLIIVRTNIAEGTAKQGKASAHGEPLGEENIAAMKAAMGWTYDKFEIPAEVYAHYESLAQACAKENAAYDAMLESYRAAYPELYAEWLAWHSAELPEALLADESLFAAEGPKATRATSGDVLNKLAAYLPNFFGGSADLAPSNKTEMKGRGFFAPDCREGANIHFGVRELAMACIANGIALYGGLRAYCATFFVFSDYVKPALRLSALMQLPVLYILTHDSIGVGEDGPTHQPIEQLAALRATPNTFVFRPADQKETAYAYLTALTLKAPSVLALTRQNLPQLAETGEGAKRGAYILREPKGEPDVILMASGSEVETVMEAAKILADKGVHARVVSMPCTNLFDMQDAAYRESVLPKAVRARVAVEAASDYGWHKYTGLDGKVVSINHFGASAPAGVLFREFGMTPENVAKAALETIG